MPRKGEPPDPIAATISIEDALRRFGKRVLPTAIVPMKVPTAPGRHELRWAIAVWGDESLADAAQRASRSGLHLGIYRDRSEAERAAVAFSRLYD
jgi:hypothetical protein